jgi:hypothetical protein
MKPGFCKTMMFMELKLCMVSSDRWGALSWACLIIINASALVRCFFLGWPGLTRVNPSDPDPITEPGRVLKLWKKIIDALNWGMESKYCLH